MPVIITLLDQPLSQFSIYLPVHLLNLYIVRFSTRMETFLDDDPLQGSKTLLKSRETTTFLSSSTTLVVPLQKAIRFVSHDFPDHIRYAYYIPMQPDDFFYSSCVWKSLPKVYFLSPFQVLRWCWVACSFPDLLFKIEVTLILFQVSETSPNCCILSKITKNVLAMASATSLQYSQMQLIRHHRIRCVHLVPVLSGNKKSPPQMVSLPCSRPSLWSHGPGLSEDLPVSAVTNETKNNKKRHLVPQPFLCHSSSGSLHHSSAACPGLR